MTHLFRRFFDRHPALRDALLWVIPAVVFGAVLRLMFLHYSPYAYWGSDSRSYYEFAHEYFTNEQALVLNEKRRFLYPIFMAFVTALPGIPLKWVAWLQHGFGLLTLVPLAYVVRKVFTFWHLWIIPITLLYAGLPVVLWYEHELLGETLFFAFIVWAFAGWVAWAREPQWQRAARLWWLFFLPFALLILTKPSARFFWPGLLVGLVMIAGWRKLQLFHYIALLALMVVTLQLGSPRQGKWLLYVAAFPLTQLDTPLHAEYKAEIKDMIEARRDRLDYYYSENREPFQFTRSPKDHPERQLWSQTGNDERAAIYMDLALEGIKAEPLNFLYLGLQRVVFSANPSVFGSTYFASDYLAVRFKPHYDGAEDRLKRRKRTPHTLVLGLPDKGPLPPYEELAAKFAPAPNSFSARFIKSWVDSFHAVADLVSAPKNAKLSEVRPTALGCWLLFAMALSFTRAYRSTFGVWTLTSVGYLVAVFLVSLTNPRYFGPVWVVFLPLLVLPLDALLYALQERRSRKMRTLPSSAPELAKR